MKPFILNRNLAQLALLQRIELANDDLKKKGKYLEDIFFRKYSQNILLILKKFQKITHWL